MCVWMNSRRRETVFKCGKCEEKKTWGENNHVYSIPPLSLGSSFHEKK